MSVSPAREGDRDAVIATVVAAFADDPVERFAVTGVAQHGACPPITLMLRERRGAG